MSEPAPTHTSATAATPISLSALFGVFFRIGLFSFGGGVSAWMHRETVTKRRWIDEQQFLSGLALSQILPGANVSNLAVYIGLCMRGWVGATTALFAVLSGPTVVVIAFAEVYPQLIAIAGFHSAMDGIATAAAGMIIRLAWLGGVHSCRKPTPIVIATATFVAVGVLHFPLVPVVLVLAPISIGLAWRRRLTDA